MTLAPDAVIIAWIWPRRSSCAACSHTEYAITGSYGRIQYRRCTECTEVSKIIAVAAHIDRGGDQSEVASLD